MDSGSGNNYTSPPLSERTRNRGSRRASGVVGVSAGRPSTHVRPAPAPAPPPPPALTAAGSPDEVQEQRTSAAASTSALAAAAAEARAVAAASTAPRVSPSPPPSGRTSPDGPGAGPIPVPEVNAAVEAAAAALNNGPSVDAHDTTHGAGGLFEQMREMEELDSANLVYWCPILQDFPESGRDAVFWHGHWFGAAMLFGYLDYASRMNRVLHDGRSTVQCPACQAAVSTDLEPRQASDREARDIDVARESYNSRSGQRDQLAARRAEHDERTRYACSLHVLSWHNVCVCALLCPTPTM